MLSRRPNRRPTRQGRNVSATVPDETVPDETVPNETIAASLIEEGDDASTPPGRSAAEEVSKEATKPRYGEQSTPGGSDDAHGDAKRATGALGSKLFDRWPKPKLAVVISGLQNGYLEPCGCAGLDNMKGGLMRRHTFLKSLTDPAGQGWPAVLAVDLGNLVGRFGWQAEQKYEVAVRSLKVMDYDAIAYGPDDLRLGPNALILAAEAAEANARFVAANVAIDRWESAPPVRYRTVERGGYKVGITAVLGNKYSAGLAEILTKPAAGALAEVMPKLAAERCDLLILLSHATMEETKALLKRFPNFDIVVTAGGPDEPPLREEKLPGTKTWLIESGRKGMYLQVIGLFDDGARRAVSSGCRSMPSSKTRPTSRRCSWSSRSDTRTTTKSEKAWRRRTRTFPAGRDSAGSGRSRTPRAARSWVARPAAPAIPRPTACGRRPDMPKPPRRWRSWPSRGYSIPSASVAMRRAGSRRSIFPSRAAMNHSPRHPT